MQGDLAIVGQPLSSVLFNSAGSKGGGVFVNSSLAAVAISGALFSDNYAYFSGAAAYLANNNTVVSDSQIKNNMVRTAAQS